MMEPTEQYEFCFYDTPILVFQATWTLRAILKLRKQWTIRRPSFFNY
jgi:hypothetical protein